MRYLVLDWNHRDQKQRRMVDIPEVRLTQTHTHTKPYKKKIIIIISIGI